MKVLGLLTVLSCTAFCFLSGCGEAEQFGCTSDLDCRSGRVCLDNGICASPTDKNNANNQNNQNNTNNQNNLNNQNNMPAFTCEDACKRVVACVENGEPNADECVKACKEDDPTQALLSCIGMSQSCEELFACEPEAGTGPQIRVTPSSLAFEGVEVNETVVKDLLLENIGDEDLVLKRVEFTANDLPVFNIGQTPIRDGAVIPPGTAINILVAFSPTEAGQYFDTLLISNNDADANDRTLAINLKGFAKDVGIPGQGCLGFFPDPLHFMVERNQMKTQTLTMDNCSSQTKIEVYSVTSSHPRSLEFTSSLPLQLGPNDKSDATISLFGAGPERFEGELTFKYRAFTADGTPQNVSETLVVKGLIQ